MKRMEVAGLIQALITVLTAIAPVVETIVVMRLITAVVLLLVAEITVMMVPTTVVVTVPVAKTMKDQTTPEPDYGGDEQRWWRHRRR